MFVKFISGRLKRLTFLPSPKPDLFLRLISERRPIPHFGMFRLDGSTSPWSLFPFQGNNAWPEVRLFFPYSVFLMICIFVFLLPYMTIHVRQIYQRAVEIRFDFWKKQKKETIMYNLTFLKPKNTKPEKPASTRLWISQPLDSNQPFGFFQLTSFRSESKSILLPKVYTPLYFSVCKIHIAASAKKLKPPVI